MKQTLQGAKEKSVRVSKHFCFCYIIIYSLNHINMITFYTFVKSQNIALTSR